MFSDVLLKLVRIVFLEFYHLPITNTALLQTRLPMSHAHWFYSTCVNVINVLWVCVRVFFSLNSRTTDLVSLFGMLLKITWLCLYLFLTCTNVSPVDNHVGSSVRNILAVLLFRDFFTGNQKKDKSWFVFTTVIYFLTTYRHTCITSSIKQLLGVYLKI